MYISVLQYGAGYYSFNVLLEGTYAQGFGSGHVDRSYSFEILIVQDG